MNARDRLLRAAVYRAMALRCQPDSPGWAAYLRAVEELVEADRLWPWIEAEQTLREARRRELLAEAAWAAAFWEDDAERWGVSS